MARAVPCEETTVLSGHRGEESLLAARTARMTNYRPIFLLSQHSPFGPSPSHVLSQREALAGFPHAPWPWPLSCHLPVSQSRADLRHMNPQEVSWCVCLTFELGSRRAYCANAASAAELCNKSER